MYMFVQWRLGVPAGEYPAGTVYYIKSFPIRRTIEAP